MADEILRPKSHFPNTDEVKILFFRQFATNLFHSRNYSVYFNNHSIYAVIFKIFVRLKRKFRIFAEKFGSYFQKSSSRRNPIAGTYRQGIQNHSEQF